MPEKEKLPQNQESKEQTPRPNLLDVVKIDGSWAQVIWFGNYIKYLDDESKVPINWDDFMLVKDWNGLTVIEVKESTSFTEKELTHIHWGPEQKQYPYLSGMVCVFGEFEKNPEKK